jgi:hypothetical protein
MSERYTLKNGNILDRSCGEKGRRMFLEEVISVMNQRVDLQRQLDEAREELRVEKATRAGR